MNNIQISNNQNNLNVQNNYLQNWNNKNYMENVYNKLLAQNLQNDPVKMQNYIAKEINNWKPYVHDINGHTSNKLFMSSSGSIKKDENLINIHFITLRANEHIRQYKKKDTLQFMFDDFMKFLGIAPEAIKEIYFIFSATNLNHQNKNKTLEQLRILDHSRINVIDSKNIIGA